MSIAHIKHVVVLMLENRSFDQMLGCLPEQIPGVDGVNPTDPGINDDVDGDSYEQKKGPQAVVDPDPNHDTTNVMYQLLGDNGNFVFDYSLIPEARTRRQRQNIMSYYGWNGVEALHKLSEHFVVCDRWFCSVPGPTWTNRLFALSGTSLGRVKMPHLSLDPHLESYDQQTVFDRFEEKDGLSCRVYWSDWPLTLIMLSRERSPSNLGHYRSFSRFKGDAAGPESDFPTFCFIEPRYSGVAANDDHPPHDPRRSQQLIAQTYTAIRGNEELWHSTLFVVLYDEHGGFYDHVSPPAAIPPDAHRDEYSFDRLGVRVPALLVSPRLSPQVMHNPCDHTSLLHFLRRRWTLGALGNRTAQADGLTRWLEVQGRIRATPRTEQETRTVDRAMERLATAEAPPAAQAKRLDRMEEAYLLASETLELDLERKALRKAGRSVKGLKLEPDRTLTQRRAAANRTVKSLLTG